MFRYIALCWDTDNLTGLQSANQFAVQLQTPGSGWQPALLRPGLSVFTTGADARVNTAYLMSTDPGSSNQGVVLGKLFQRNQLDTPAQCQVALGAVEAARILQTGGHALIDHYWGRYVAFLHDAASGGTRIIRDPSGALPCNLLQHRGLWIAFSWMEDVLALAPKLPPLTINWDWLAMYVVDSFRASRETAINEVSQVFAGEAVRLSRGSMSCELYWSPVKFACAAVEEDRTRAAAAMHRTVSGCALAWAGCYDSVLLRLSGGVDSSILATCLAADRTTQRVTCINDYSAGSNTDERSYARLAAAKAQRELVERERDPGFSLEGILDVLRTPTPGNYAGLLGFRQAAAELAAARGASALFEGTGGDQVFYEFPTYRPAADYVRAHGIGPGLLSAAMDAARLGRASVWKTLGFALRHGLWRGALSPEFDRGKHAHLISATVVSEVQRSQRFRHPALESIADAPPGKQEQVRILTFCPAIDFPASLNLDLEYVNPFLSQPIVELCLGLPSYLLIHGGRGRALARQAFSADLPREIAERRSKGGVEEHLNAVVFRNLEFVRRMVLDGGLMHAGILDRPKVEEVLSRRPTTLASTMGQVLMLLSIEAWLHRWATTRQKAAA